MQIRQNLTTLSEIFAPAYTRGNELEMEISQFCTAMREYSGDQTKLAGFIASLADQVEEYPMYAIRKAFKWAVRGERRMPPICDIIRDIKLAMDTDVINRRKNLQKLLGDRR